jgi:hypothetical protein
MALVPPIWSQSSETTGSVSSFTIQLSNAQVSGDTLVIFFGNQGGVGTLGSPAIADTSGNTFVQDIANTTIGVEHNFAYHVTSVIAAAANANTITIKWSGATTFSCIIVHEYRGLASNAPTTGSGTGNSAAATCNVTVNAIGDLVVASVNPDSNAGTTQGSGYTLEQTTATLDAGSEDKVATASGSQAANFTVTSGDWVIQALSFRAATAFAPEEGPGGAVVAYDSSGRLAPEILAAFTAVSEQIASATAPFNEEGIPPPLFPERIDTLPFRSPEDLASATAPFDENGPTPFWNDPPAPQQFSVGEDVAASAVASGLEEGASSVLLFTDPWEPFQTTPEELATPVVEELSQWWEADPGQPFTPAFVSGDEMASVAAPFDEGGSTPALFAEPFVLPASVSPEDLVGLPLEEPAQPVSLSPDAPFGLTPAQGEDFQGFLTVDDAAGNAAWTVGDAPVWPFSSPGEDIAGSVASSGLEDGATSVITLEQPAWLGVAEVAEDLANATAPFDESAPTWVAPQVLPWLTPSIGEDFTQTTASGLDDSGSPAIELADVATWIGVTVAEDIAQATAPFDEGGSTWVTSDQPISPIPPGSAEEFAASAAAGLEESVNAWLSGEQPSWLTAPAVSEDLAASIAAEEGGAAALITDGTSPQRTTPVAEDVAPSSALEESGTAPTVFTDPQAWVPVALLEEYPVVGFGLDEGGQPFVWPTVLPDPWPALAAWAFGEDWASPLPPTAPLVFFVVDSSKRMLVVPNQ